MEENQRPLSDFISSVEQVDAPDIPNEEVNERPKNKKSKAFPIIVGILLVLILGMGGYYVYKQYFAQGEESVNTDVTEEQVDEQSTNLLVDVLVPDESGSEDVGIKLSIPDGWSVNEDVDYAAVITNEKFSIYMTKNPIVTGGGWGFMYDGVSDTQTLVSSLVANGVSINKVTHVLAEDTVKGTDIKNIFGGSVLASLDSDVSKPTLMINNEKYLVKYVYEGDGVISIDSQEYKDAVEDMDNIVKSIVIE